MNVWFIWSLHPAIVPLFEAGALILFGYLFLDLLHTPWGGFFLNILLIILFSSYDECLTEIALARGVIYLRLSCTNDILFTSSYLIYWIKMLEILYLDRITLQILRAGQMLLISRRLRIIMLLPGYHIVHLLVTIIRQIVFGLDWFEGRLIII